VKILKYPNQLLRRLSEKIGRDDADSLWRDLVAAMIGYNGIGIAAPQIGVSRQLAVISEKADKKLKGPLVLVNPVLLESTGSQSIEEACLSVAGVTASVPRAMKITVETGLDGNRKIIEAEGFLAVVMQHEIDHLNGILFPDRLPFHRKWWKLYQARRNRRNEQD